MINELIREIIDPREGTIRGVFSDDLPMTNLSFDSMTIKEGEVFVLVSKDTADESVNMLRAIERGASAVLMEKDLKHSVKFPDHFPVIEVNNVTSIIEKMAKKYLLEVDPTIITVLGCDGKLVTKNLLYDMLKNDFQVLKTKENGNFYDTAKSIFQMDRSTDILLCDIPIIEKNTDLEEYRIIEPNFAIVTDLGSDEELREAVVRLESKMKPSAVFVIDGDDPLMKMEWKCDVVTCGRKEGALFQIHEQTQKGNFTEFSLQGIRMPFSIPSTSEYNVKYATYAIAITVHLGMLPDNVVNVLKNYKF
ncbi:Mur ligase family protein [Evansella tamaricis]|uniref:Mur ligase central domain-containing protein n=1 Tax=Evansella tamaricis TaxID=2069301 RepID=A0ABS6JGS0_9BACI|nr:Mur ligase family protein [Evansella tamaricis]MBU9712419.1 hypothetical protein [Evansella tamaricis]